MGNYCVLWSYMKIIYRIHCLLKKIGINIYKGNVMIVFFFVRIMFVSFHSKLNDPKNQKFEPHS